VQAVDIADTPIPGGLIYCALVADTTTSTFCVVGAPTYATSIRYSVYKQTAAFPLPSSATFGSTLVGNNYVYKFGALRAPRTVV
jgi:hypothetical protein